MTRAAFAVGTLAALLALCGTAQAAELGVLAPVLEKGAPLTKPGPADAPAPVVMRVTSGALYAALQKEARGGYTATTLALDELAQRKAGASRVVPTWLYLSLEEGGFPRDGFWLRETGADRYVADRFVDLVVDEASVADGSFEEIFAHEMGHIFLRRLLPNLPDGYSRTRHGSFTVTDFPTAFDEGFATHFQALARRFTANQKLRDRDLGIGQKPLTNYWYDNLDREARVAGVRGNWFIQAALPLPEPGAGAFTRIDRSNLFDLGRLKNGTQMLASEGVMATLFYRRLATGPRDGLLARYGREFDFLKAVNARKPEAGRSAFLDLLAIERAQDKSLGATDTRSFIETTYAATVDPEIAHAVEALARTGRIGDQEAFVAQLDAVRRRFTALESALEGTRVLTHPGVGPDLWVLLEIPKDTAVNLNTAELDPLVSLPGVGPASGARAIASRDASGPFRSFDDFAQRAGIDKKAAARLQERAAAMKAAGAYTRR